MSSETLAHLYGHLFQDEERRAAELIDAYLTRSDTTARLAQLDT